MRAGPVYDKALALATPATGLLALNSAAKRGLSMAQLTNCIAGLRAAADELQALADHHNTNVLEESDARSRR